MQSALWSSIYEKILLEYVVGGMGLWEYANFFRL
jgi:hypothetical protein